MQSLPCRDGQCTETSRAIVAATSLVARRPSLVAGAVGGCVVVRMTLGAREAAVAVLARIAAVRGSPRLTRLRVALRALTGQACRVLGGQRMAVGARGRVRRVFERPRSACRVA